MSRGWCFAFGVLVAAGCGRDAATSTDTFVETPAGTDSNSEPTTGGTPTEPAGGTGPFDCIEEISDDPLHSLEVTDADIIAAVEKTYDLQGAADHNHTITINPYNFVSIQKGPHPPLIKTSTFDDALTHNHTVVITCDRL